MTGKHGGARPGAGRKKGRVSAAKRDLAEKAKTHAETALKALADIARKGESESARVSAATAILDRAYGKPAQSHQLSGPRGGPIPTMDVAKLKGMTNEELDLLERALVQIGIADGDPAGEGGEAD